MGLCDRTCMRGMLPMLKAAVAGLLLFGAGIFLVARGWRRKGAGTRAALSVKEARWRMAGARNEFSDWLLVLAGWASLAL